MLIALAMPLSYWASTVAHAPSLEIKHGSEFIYRDAGSVGMRGMQVAVDTSGRACAEAVSEPEVQGSASASRHGER